MPMTNCDFFLIMQTGNTALMWAASQNHVAAMEVLLISGAEKDMQNSVRVLPIHSVRQRNELSVFSLQEGNTAVMIAALNGHIASVELLLCRSANREASDKVSARASGLFKLSHAPTDATRRLDTRP